MTDRLLSEALSELWRRNPKRARVLLSEFIAHRPGEASGFAYRSLCFRMEGKLSEAVADVQRGLALESESGAARAAEVIALFAKKQVGPAIVSARKIRDARRNDPEAHFLFLLADALVTESYFEGLERQIRRDPHRTEPNYNDMRFIKGPVTRAAFDLLDGKLEEARHAFPGPTAPGTHALIVMTLAAFRILELRRVNGEPILENLKAGCQSSLISAKDRWLAMYDREMRESDGYSRPDTYRLELATSAALLWRHLEDAM
ncbi:MAG: hypothetical protein ABL932_07565 [Terricaulis sp.]